MTDSYLYVIVALLPVAASMVVVQVNPYHALVIRGILGAIAALVYAVLGAADVALTEALVGTMLAITLYAVAVRSSLVMRLGVLEEAFESQSKESDLPFAVLLNDFRTFLSKHYMRLELVSYETIQDLHQALVDNDIHAMCVQRSPQPFSAGDEEQPPYQTTVRIQRLHDLMQVELTSSATSLSYLQTSPVNTVVEPTVVREVQP